jgi:hypothetical protein
LLVFLHVEYKGPPDPLRGDEIYKRVRDAARVRTVILKIIFLGFQSNKHAGNIGCDI